MAKSSSILNFDGELPSSDIWLISAGPYDSMIRSLCLPSGVSHSLVGQSLSGTPDRTRRWVNDIAYIYMDMILILWSYGMTFGCIIMITHTHIHIYKGTFLYLRFVRYLDQAEVFLASWITYFEPVASWSLQNVFHGHLTQAIRRIASQLHVDMVNESMTGPSSKNHRFNRSLGHWSIEALSKMTGPAKIKSYQCIDGKM